MTAGRNDEILTRWNLEKILTNRVRGIDSNPVHIGIDTVNLKGEPFEVFVKAGDIVDNNTLLATVNLNVLEEKEIISDVLVIITSDSYKNLEMFQYGQVEAGHIIGSLHLR